MSTSSNPRFANPGERTQRAAIYNQYGEQVHVESNLAIDDQLADNEVLVNVASTSVNPIDSRLPTGVFKDSPVTKNATFPMVIGFDLSGKIVKIGSKVQKFKIGDEVFGLAESYWNGCFCEYFKISENSIVKKSSKLSYNEAASIPATGVTAYQGIIQHGQLKAGQSILIIGGASGVGLFGIQIAKNTGASRIVTTCGATNANWVKGLGANTVIDYKKDDFAKVLDGEKFDVVFDAAGGAEDREKAFELVKPDGYFVTTNPGFKQPQGRPNSGVVHFAAFVVNIVGQAHVLEEMNKWSEAGTFTAKIDSVFQLDQLQEALDKSQGGKLSGKIVIEINRM